VSEQIPTAQGEKALSKKIENGNKSKQQKNLERAILRK
jgi:hypothetical protein